MTSSNSLKNFVVTGRGSGNNNGNSSTSGHFIHLSGDANSLLIHGCGNGSQPSPQLSGYWTLSSHGPSSFHQLYHQSHCTLQQPAGNHNNNNNIDPSSPVIHQRSRSVGGGSKYSLDHSKVGLTSVNLQQSSLMVNMGSTSEQQRLQLTDNHSMMTPSQLSMSSSTLTSAPIKSSVQQLPSFTSPYVNKYDTRVDGSNLYSVPNRRTSIALKSFDDSFLFSNKSNKLSSPLALPPSQLHLSGTLSISKTEPDKFIYQFTTASVTSSINSVTLSTMSYKYEKQLPVTSCTSVIKPISQSFTSTPSMINENVYSTIDPILPPSSSPSSSRSSPSSSLLLDSRLFCDSDSTTLIESSVDDVDFGNIEYLNHQQSKQSKIQSLSRISFNNGKPPLGMLNNNISNTRLPLCYQRTTPIMQRRSVEMVDTSNNSPDNLRSLLNRSNSFGSGQHRRRILSQPSSTDYQQHQHLQPGLIQNTYPNNQLHKIASNYSNNKYISSNSSQYNFPPSSNHSQTIANQINQNLIISTTISKANTISSFCSSADTFRLNNNLPLPIVSKMNNNSSQFTHNSQSPLTLTSTSNTINIVSQPKPAKTWIETDLDFPTGYSRLSMTTTLAKTSSDSNISQKNIDSNETSPSSIFSSLNFSSFSMNNQRQELNNQNNKTMINPQHQQQQHQQITTSASQKHLGHTIHYTFGGKTQTDFQTVFDKKEQQKLTSIQHLTDQVAPLAEFESSVDDEPEKEQSNNLLSSLPFENSITKNQLIVPDQSLNNNNNNMYYAQPTHIVSITTSTNNYHHQHYNHQSRSSISSTSSSLYSYPIVNHSVHPSLPSIYTTVNSLVTSPVHSNRSSISSTASSFFMLNNNNQCSNCLNKRTTTLSSSNNSQSNSTPNGSIISFTMYPQPMSPMCTVAFVPGQDSKSTSNQAKSTLSSSSSQSSSSHHNQVPIASCKGNIVEVDVVTVGHFQPGYEEEKPFTMDDFYKYSQKYRNANKANTNNRNNTNKTNIDFVATTTIGDNNNNESRLDHRSLSKNNETLTLDSEFNHTLKLTSQSSVNINEQQLITNSIIAADHQLYSVNSINLNHHIPCITNSTPLGTIIASAPTSDDNNNNLPVY